MGALGGVGALGGIGASLLSTSNLSGARMSLSCSPGMLARRLTQRLRWMVQDLGAIAKDGSLNVIFPNGLADSLSMKLLKL